MKRKLCVGLLCIGLGVGMITLLFASYADCESACTDAYSDAMAQCCAAQSEAVNACADAYEAACDAAEQARDETEAECEAAYKEAEEQCYKQYQDDMDLCTLKHYNSVTLAWEIFYLDYDGCAGDPACELNAIAERERKIAQHDKDWKACREDALDAYNDCRIPPGRICVQCLEDATDYVQRRDSTSGYGV